MNALHHAALEGSLENARSFIGAGVDINARELLGFTPLHYSAESGHADIVKALIAAGADVNAEGPFGATSLHFSAAIGHAVIVKALIAAGADVNAKKSVGDTPLHLSAKNGHADIVRALIAAGADATAEVKGGKTAFDFIHSNRNEVKKTFIKYTMLYQYGSKLKLKLEHGDSELRKIWIECEEQVKKMKETWLCGSFVSLFNFITETDENKLAVYSFEGNFCIKNDLERISYIKKFPMYAEDIEDQFNKGSERANLLHKSKELMIHCFCYTLPPEIVRKICEYMSNDDMGSFLMLNE